MKYNHMKKSIMAAALLAGAVFASFQTQAATESYALDSLINGTSPGTTVPWMTATFTDGAPGTVLLSISATSLYPTAFVTEFDFNLDPTLNVNPVNIVTTNGGVGTVTSTYNHTNVNDSFTIDGTGGQADLQILFSQVGTGQFTAGETAVFAITGIPGISASMFNFASSGSTTGPWYVAARADGVPCAGGCGVTTIAWIGDCTSVPNNTPEPATMAILGSFIAFGVYLKRRNGQSVKA